MAKVTFGEARRGEVFPKYRVEAGADPARVTVYTVVQILWAGATPDALKKRVDESVAVVRGGMNKYIQSASVPPEYKDGSLGWLECTTTGDRDPGLMEVFYSMNLKKSPLDKKAHAGLAAALESVFGRGVVERSR